MKLSEARFHFIGVGGIGMSALAELLHQMGAKVYGSDMKLNTQTQYLQKLGVTVFEGHKSENIQPVDAIVYSSAIKDTNVEIIQGRSLGIPIIPRAEALAEIMRFKRGIAIGGTHGKTTTTSMLAAIFLNSDLDPTIAVGGRLKLIESTARLGQGPWIVAEADESDGSFSRLSPEISVITNIDEDHLDHFGTFENIEQGFLNFALKVPFFGTAIVCGDDPKTRQLFSNFPKRLVFYGFDEKNDYILRKQKSNYQVIFKGNELGTFQLTVPGKHNALNGLAACIAAFTAGVPWSECFLGVNQYSGVDRRFEQIGKKDGWTVYDDYAHHPTEVRATLDGAREKYPDARLHILFQPHRFTRTRDCWQDLLGSFNDADQIYLVDIYPAGEKPIEGVHSRALALQLGDKAHYCESFESGIELIESNVKAGDVVMTMGAGNIWQCGQQLLGKTP